MMKRTIGVVAVLGVLVGGCWGGSKPKEKDRPVAKVEAVPEVVQGPKNSPEWAVLMSSVQVGPNQKYRYLDEWCKSNVGVKFPEAAACYEGNHWYWCDRPGSEDCNPPGNPFEQKDNEANRLTIRQAVLAAPLIYNYYISNGTQLLTVSDYDMKNHKFTFYVKDSKMLDSVKGKTVSGVHVSSVDTLLGPVTETRSFAYYDNGSMTFEMPADEAKAKEIYSLILPFGCPEGRCETRNVELDMVYRLKGNQKVPVDQRYDNVYQVVGYRLRVARQVESFAGKHPTTPPNTILVERILTP